jgi:hypothetical protein
MSLFEELKGITEKKREENKILFQDKIKIATEDAIKHITQDSYEKMKSSALKGFDNTNIYTYKWVSENDSEFDSNGNKTLFEGNIRLTDLVNKYNFINALDKHFNNDGNNNFHCSIFKLKDNKDNKDKDNNEVIWIINVSWGHKKDKKYSPKLKSNDKKI